MNCTEKLTLETAIKKVRALKLLERDSHSKTTRAQNEVIRSLNDEQLAEFALSLYESELTNDNNK